MRFITYHPAITFMYLFTVILFTCYFQHPVFLCLSALGSFLYSTYLRLRQKPCKHTILVPVIIVMRLFGAVVLIWLYTCFYCYGHHFGGTNLEQNVVGNYITLESLACGLSIGIRIVSVLMWFACVHQIMTTDKIVYLFGRISPRMSLYMAIIMRTIPHIKEKARKVNEAQTCLGKGIGQGNAIMRLKNVFRMISIITTWTLEHFKDTSDSMKSRGYSLKGRTAFSVYRFDNRDRVFVTWLFLFITILCVGAALNQNTVTYNPVIFVCPITSLSYVFYSTYFIFLLIPLVLELKIT